MVAGSDQIQIEKVERAEDAIAVAASFDAIVIDINFAANGLDGISAVRAMRKNGIQAKIIVNSNDTSEQTHQAALRAGANAFWPKPMTAKALATILA
jgi:CheY-like chemotaxis protein